MSIEEYESSTRATSEKKTRIEQTRQVDHAICRFKRRIDVKPLEKKSFKNV